jgi:kumamolisin
MIGTISRGAVLASLLLGIQAFATPMTTMLRLNERVTMEQLAANVYNPASPHYGRFYEPAEIRAVSAPVDADYNKLLADLKAEGFTIVSESPSHLFVTIRGEQAIYESIFNTKVMDVGHGMHKASKAVSVPFQYQLIASVSGLDNTRKAQPHYIPAKNGKGKGKGGSDGGADMGVQPSAIKTAYGFDPIYKAGISGKGVDIAVATYDGFMVDNVTSYYTQVGVSPMSTVDQVMFNGTPTYDQDSSAETELDSEFSGMIAAGASVHVFASATNDDPGELAVFTAILDDNRAKIANYSWGSCETTVTSSHASDMDKVFARAIAQGVNIMIATGDSGSDSCGDGTNKADWPASHPDVVGVGGTTFNQNGSTLSETAWSGSGGGISALWPLPAWQSALGAPYTMRSYPDVAFNADPNSGEAIYTGPSGGASWMVIGGTSMAAPQWSGFMALVQASRTAAGKPGLGALSPIIYGMTAANRATTFNDVTSGNNGLYNAGPGWDAVTGWGSMQANNLLTYLTAQ